MCEASAHCRGILVAPPTVILLLVLASSTAAQSVIKVAGQVRDTLAPFGAVPENLIVQIEYSDGDRAADYNWSPDLAKYEIEMHQRYAGTPLVLLVLHPDWTQTQPDTLVPTSAGLYQRTLWIIRQSNLAEVYYDQSLGASAEKSLRLCLQAIALQARPRYFLGAVNSLGRLLREGPPLPVDELRLMRQWRHLPKVAELGNSLRFDIAWEFATALSRGDMAADVEPSVTLFDLTLEAYEWANEIQPADAKPYQGLYHLQADAGLYADAARSLSEFFQVNSTVTNERTIITFIGDWAYALEQRTGVDDSTDRDAVDLLPVQLRDEWRALVGVMERYRHVWSVPAFETRFRGIWERANNFASGS